ncbi:MAG: hypothetical protein H0W81_10175 [Chloroflexi bacterium]|nr:hypothetical protein [Chloroflexota bacterium]
MVDLAIREAKRVGLDAGVATVGLESSELQLGPGARKEDEAAGRWSITQDLVPKPAHFSNRRDRLPVVDDEGARLRQALVHLSQEIGRHPRPR